ncbi:MAG: GNVR domain-containing protein, partial [Betaproteobacteria bacterium]
LFELFAKQYEIARVDEARQGALIQVVDFAQPPEKKAKPQKALIAIIATLASGFALLLFVLVRQALRNAGQDKGGDYVSNYRNFKYYETLFELFAKQYELARVDESREGAVIQVLDAAQPPERKSKPKKALIAIIATLASGFALLLFVFVRQALRNGAQDGETAQKLASIQTSWRKALGRA